MSTSFRARSQRGTPSGPHSERARKHGGLQMARCFPWAMKGSVPSITHRAHRVLGRIAEAHARGVAGLDAAQADRALCDSNKELQSPPGLLMEIVVR